MSSYVPLSSETHRDKRWLRYPSVVFAAHDNVVPIYANEIAEAIHVLPIAFVKIEGRFTLAVVMGLRPGENLLVSESGQWLASYTPVNYRTRPFMMLDAVENSDQQILCIEESRIAEGSLGEPIFNESGNITAVVNEVLKLMTHYSSTYLLTRNICELLDKYNLIIPWNITVDDGTTNTPINGLFRIDETALKELPDQDFLNLRDSSALSVIYGQLFSMNNMTELSKLLTQRTQAATALQKQEDSGGTFNFAGL
jgi:hypothetical protein